MDDLGPTKPNRRSFQFSLRTLIAFVVLLFVVMSWLAMKMRQAERQRQTVEAIREAGGLVWYDRQLDESGMATAKQESPAPAWLRELFGEDSFSDVTGVPESQVTDAGVQDLKRLTSLEILDLSNTPFTDEGVVELRKSNPNWRIEL